jgi:serine/threonine protein kinase
VNEPDPSAPSPRPRSALDGLDPRLLMAEGLGLSPDESGDDAPVVPGYEILRLLGAGGMGRVWLARQTSLDRLVAVKVLAMRGAAATQWLDRLEREARSMARLSHPHIVAVYDFVRLEEGGAAIVMEWVASGSLREKWLEPGKPVRDWRAVLAIVRQIASALVAAHGAGIVHRDLKPENILVSVDGTAKVTDFGLALPLGPESQRLTLSGTSVGTLGYMAPEQVEGREVDGRADLYSLGVMLYEMLTGLKPQGHFDPPGRLRRDLPSGLEALVMQCLRTRPEKRLASAQEFLARLDRCGKTRLALVMASLVLLGLLGWAGVSLLPSGPDPIKTPVALVPEPPPQVVTPNAVESKEGNASLVELRPGLFAPADWARRLDFRPLSGVWKDESGGLQSDSGISIVQLLTSLPPEGCRVKIAFTRLEGIHSVALFFRTARGVATAELSSWDQSFAGFQTLDGLDLRTLPDPPVFPMENSRRYEMEVEIRPERLRLSVEGRLLQEVEIQGRELGITYPWSWDSLSKDSTWLGLGTYESPTLFHSVIIEPLKD